MENGKWKVKLPIRMCVVCRKRFYQKELNRLQCKNKKIISFSGVGRSFYVCGSCINDKKLIKYILRLCNISKEEAKNQIFHFPFSIVN
ncbi:YlxR family protein [Caminibacter profundus]